MCTVLKRGARMEKETVDAALQRGGYSGPRCLRSSGGCPEREKEGARQRVKRLLGVRCSPWTDWVDCIVTSRPLTWVARYGVSRANTQSEERLDRVSVQVNGAGVPPRVGVQCKPYRTAPKIGFSPPGPCAVAWELCLGLLFAPRRSQIVLVGVGSRRGWIASSVSSHSQLKEQKYTISCTNRLSTTRVGGN
jgi:hypothetical protein